MAPIYPPFLSLSLTPSSYASLPSPLSSSPSTPGTLRRGDDIVRCQLVRNYGKAKGVKENVKERRKIKEGGEMI
jgi:hypothetical protein